MPLPSQLKLVLFWDTSTFYLRRGHKKEEEQEREEEQTNKKKNKKILWHKTRYGMLKYIMIIIIHAEIEVTQSQWTHRTMKIFGQTSAEYSTPAKQQPETIDHRVWFFMLLRNCSTTWFNARCQVKSLPDMMARCSSCHVLQVSQVLQVFQAQRCVATLCKTGFAPAPLTSEAHGGVALRVTCYWLPLSCIVFYHCVAFDLILLL